MQVTIYLPRLSILVKSWVALSNLKGTRGSCSRVGMVFDSLPVLNQSVRCSCLDQQPAGMAFPCIGFEIIGARCIVLYHRMKRNHFLDLHNPQHNQLELAVRRAIEKLAELI